MFTCKNHTKSCRFSKSGRRIEEPIINLLLDSIMLKTCSKFTLNSVHKSKPLGNLQAGLIEQSLTNLDNLDKLGENLFQKIAVRAKWWFTILLGGQMGKTSKMTTRPRIKSKKILSSKLRTHLETKFLIITWIKRWQTPIDYQELPQLMTKRLRPKTRATPISADPTLNLTRHLNKTTTSLRAKNQTLSKSRRWSSRRGKTRPLP